MVSNQNMPEIAQRGWCLFGPLLILGLCMRGLDGVRPSIVRESVELFGGMHSCASGAWVVHVWVHGLAVGLAMLFLCAIYARGLDWSPPLQFARRGRRCSVRVGRGAGRFVMCLGVAILRSFDILLTSYQSMQRLDGSCIVDHERIRRQ